MDLLNIVGSVASIGAAIFAFFEASKAKSFAKKAQEIKDTISTEQRKIFLSRILTETKKIMGVSIKMTTPATPTKKLRGLDYQSSIEQLREFIDSLKENGHYLSAESHIIVETNYLLIEEKLKEVAMEENQQQKYELGDEIHKAMGEMIKVIKPQLDV